MGGLIWREARINGDRCYFAGYDEQRVYVKERASTVEGWVGSKKIGNFASVDAAKEACAQRVGAPAPVIKAAPKPRPKTLMPPANYARRDPREVGPPRQMLVGDKASGRKPPVRVEHEVKLHRYPLADLSKGPDIALADPIPPDFIEKRIQGALIASGSAPTTHGLCTCGAKLGRSGKCPALCEPVPQPPPAYTGPAIVGHTHVGRLGAPAWTPPRRLVRDPADGWIG